MTEEEKNIVIVWNKLKEQKDLIQEERESLKLLDKRVALLKKKYPKGFNKLINKLK